MDIDEFKSIIETKVISYVDELAIAKNFDNMKWCEFRINKGSETIWFCNSAVIKIIQSKNNETRLEFSKKYVDLFGLQDELIFTKSEANWSRLSFTDHLATQIINNVRAVFKHCFLNGSAETFGCCSRYEECSDQKKCLHPDILLARGCYYKKNLEDGRIFYGVNRNID